MYQLKKSMQEGTTLLLTKWNTHIHSYIRLGNVVMLTVTYLDKIDYAGGKTFF